MNGAVSKVNKKSISHLTRAKRTPSAAATVPVSHALITNLKCVHPGYMNKKLTVTSDLSRPCDLLQYAQLSCGGPI